MPKCSSVLAVLLFASSLSAASVEGQATWYVDDDVSTSGDGLTWPTGCKHLQDALALATRGDEIRVAEGTCKPDYDEGGSITPGDREATFQFISGVSLYSGYSGLANPGNRDAERSFEWLGPWELAQQAGLVALFDPWADDLVVWTEQPGFSGCWASYSRQFRVFGDVLVTLIASVEGTTGSQEFDRARIFLTESGLSLPALEAEFSYHGWPPQFGWDVQTSTVRLPEGTYVVQGSVGAQWTLFGWPVYAQLDEGRLQLNVALMGDFDGDGDVDLDDLDWFGACFTGPNGGPVGPECEPGDFDGDDDIDCDDWGLFKLAWTGPPDNPPPYPSCDGGVIPTVSEWGLVAMTLLVLTAGTLVYACRRPVAQVQ